MKIKLTFTICVVVGVMILMPGTAAAQGPLTPDEVVGVLVETGFLESAEGELVLETLVIDGDENTVLVPGDRYAQMRNVYFIPSALALKNWLKKCGFVDIRIADVSVTTTEEQRRTEWMVTESLADFLDPHDPGKTVEGYPAPKRAVLIARKP